MSIVLDSGVSGIIADPLELKHANRVVGCLGNLSYLGVILIRVKLDHGVIV